METCSVMCSVRPWPGGSWNRGRQVALGGAIAAPRLTRPALACLRPWCVASSVVLSDLEFVVPRISAPVPLRVCVCVEPSSGLLAGLPAPGISLAACEQREQSESRGDAAQHGASRHVLGFITRRRCGLGRKGG